MIIKNNYNHMSRTLFFTTMINHRPVYTNNNTDNNTDNNNNNNRFDRRNKNAFHLTSMRNSSDKTPTPNNVPRQILQNTLARSTQPTFSVSAMFGVRSGTGCSACGH
jgi:hypothetical protein